MLKNLKRNVVLILLSIILTAVIFPALTNLSVTHIDDTPAECNDPFACFGEWPNYDQYGLPFTYKEVIVEEVINYNITVQVVDILIIFLLILSIVFAIYFFIKLIITSIYAKRKNRQT
jgi:hypothetical protein